MIAASMFMVRYAILAPIFKISNLRLHVDQWVFHLIVLSIVLLAAGGNVINDIRDVEADKINKPGVNKVGTKLKVQSAWIYYFVLTSLGLFLGFIINYKAGVAWLTLIQIFIGLSLWFYSNRLNSIPLVGNALIATLIAILPAIVTIYDLPLILIISRIDLMEFFLTPGKSVDFEDYFSCIVLVIFAYSIFAYLQNMARELTKDIIDIEGDQFVKCRTAPTVYGIANTKKLIFASLIILILVQVAYIVFLQLNFPSTNLFLLPTVTVAFLAPVIYSFRILHKANSRMDYENLSRWNKISQIIGMFTMFYFYFLNT